VQLYGFVSQSSEFCHHNPLCCFSMSVCCCLFCYRLSSETFAYTLVPQFLPVLEACLKLSFGNTSSCSNEMFIIVSKTLNPYSFKIFLRLWGSCLTCGILCLAENCSTDRYHHGEFATHWTHFCGHLQNTASLSS